MRHTFDLQGVCVKRMNFILDGDIVRDIHFESGCDGNLQGIARLAEGKKAAEIMELLAGITCGNKSTSCPDQFARVLRQISG